MTTPTDWQDAAVYQRLRALPACGLAWEFLRRNPGYRQAWRASARGLAGAADNLCEAWGLRFPG
ncbi:transcriptional regulator domain-containing protein [Phenylobacterium montanum]|uniref:Transcriptional regulator-like domain-containing protein n=1 Tax=Phenylobacterium montanum TaxID=2823693 RepID=A0A975IWZ8_9CAUL|nr:DUF6499 domain-containing protein [Caulobacter sp. S6]QUD90423.1 hypothetical protein KCG34_11435 [Caulobacter sp. S6]